MLITGGAGFIGSHLCEALYRLEAQITILDNLSSGSIENLKHVLNAHKSIRFYKGDCVNPHDIEKSLKNIEVVFHFAANPEVRLERNDPKTCFQQNVYATHVLLEGIKNKAQVHTIVFASTSTVYGDATLIPTPENYAPLKPLSVYGASKLASEALIIAYAHTYNKKAIILRFANIIGSRSQHGVIHDFIQKLRNNPKQLMILGDGNQNKSYLYINDCINAVLTVLETSQNDIEIFNVGSEDRIAVHKIAKMVTEEMGLHNTVFLFDGGVDGGRGWKGDVKSMLLDISKLKAKGWKPKYNSERAVKRTIREILSSAKIHINNQVKKK